MNKNRENVLLSFWLPLRKSNFINSIDSTSKDNLVNKIINFSFEYHLDITTFEVNLTDTEYNSIFKLQETKPNRTQRKHVKKHLSGDKDIQLTGDVKQQKQKDKQDIKSHDTLTVHKYQISKINKNNDDYLTNYKDIEVNFSRTEINNINHLCLKFKFTKKSLMFFKELNFFQEDLKKFTPSLLLSLEFRFFIDEYGFYFIDIETYKPMFFEIDYQLKELFIYLFFSFKKDRFSLLTSDQQHIIKDGLLFEYDMDTTDMLSEKKEEIEKEKYEKIENFFKKIIKVYHYKNFEKKENFDILPIKELVYILDKRNDNELKKRIYNIPFFNYCYSENKKSNKLIKEWILDTDKYLSNEKIEFLYKLFLQDQIEKNAMSVFLEVATSINYIGQIINKIKEARDNLRDLITDTTESVGEKSDNYNKKELTEEELARYIEKIFSKIPNLKTIDTFLQEAYYIKVGNYSFINYIEESENIATLYQYIKWKNLLDNIDNTALSLETILQVYQNRQALEELEELRRNELSTSDKNDVKNISHNDKQNIVLDESQKDFLIILGLIIAFSDFYKGMWESIYKIFFTLTDSSIFAVIFSITSAIGILYALSKILPFTYKIIFHNKEVISPYFLGINTIELRSKRKLDIPPIEHEKDHNFTKKIEKVISHIEKTISPSSLTLLDMGKRRILFTRLNPRKRTIQIKYIFDENDGNDFFELTSLNIRKKDLYNKNLKIKFFVVYFFVLKLNKENADKDFFDLYNSSAKVYFNIGTVGKIKKKSKIKEDEDLIRQKLYKLFLENFNSK